MMKHNFEPHNAGRRILPLESSLELIKKEQFCEGFALAFTMCEQPHMLMDAKLEAALKEQPSDRAKRLAEVAYRIAQGRLK
jgi:hypothetical protein